ncbi:MAG: tRNA (adenosine(37)-N6)-threonylcarbamoyltransferase complex dimerization subunit type 1 TsaB [Chitinophagaceae bacterium]|nr:tRNA (adenosine(37)-N6)-threonylcarbamoyltransferase complex dimerization subunit type 1 TsaB [Chitinophagaceae bacterium]
MGLILHIDCATEKALVCFAKDGEVMDAATNQDQKDHAGFLQTAIQQLAAKNHIELKNIDAVAVTNGPGSYTGLRVGMASAKGLCYALNKPLLTISTLELLAIAAIQSSLVFAKNTATYICPMIDARRMEVFTAIFTGNLKIILPEAPVILTQNSFENLLSNHTILFIGNGSNKIKGVITHPNACLDEINITAKAISYKANQLFVNQQFTDLIYSEPNYTKAFVDSSNKKIN